MKSIQSLAVAIIAVLLATATLAQTKPAPLKPGSIYVGTMGPGKDADDLRIALGFELAQAGFKVVDFEPQADTVLTGLIVTRVEAGQSAKRVTTFLKDRHTGKMIWNEDFGSTYTASKFDPIRHRAQEIAKALKEDSSPKRIAQKKK